MLSAGTETTEAFKPHPQHIECACALERGRYHGTIITRYRVSAPQLIFSVLVHQEGGRSDGTLQYIYILLPFAQMTLRNQVGSADKLHQSRWMVAL